MIKRIRQSDPSAPRFCAELLESRVLLSAAKLVQDLNTGGAPAPNNTYILGHIGDWAIFAAQDATHGLEPWRTNGTTGGTFMLKDINPGQATSYPGADASSLVSTPKYLYFSAFDGPNESLWRTDGTVAGTIRLTNYNSSGAFLSAVGNRLFFTTGPAGQNQTLWTSDGTVAGTHQVIEIDPIQNFKTGNNSSAVLNGELYFAADGINGEELWKSDGTAKGTVMVADLTPGIGSTNPSDFYVVGSRVFFTGAVAGKTNPGLWQTDGTAAGTKLIAVLPEQLTNNPEFQVAGDVFYILFDGTEPKPYELWRSDGTAAGSFVVHDFTGFSFILSADPTANRIYVVQDEESELWSIAGHKVKHIHAVMDDSYFDPAQVGGYLFFTDAITEDANQTVEGLWRSDGTITGTVRIQTFKANEGSQAIAGLTAVGDDVDFVHAQSIQRYDEGEDMKESKAELWKSDGTSAGTVLVKALPNASRIGLIDQPVVVGGSTLYFTETDPQNGQEIWKTNGTDGGTRLLSDAFPGTSDASPSMLTAGVGGVYFLAASATPSVNKPNDVSVCFTPNDSHSEVVLIPDGGTTQFIGSVGSREVIVTDNDVWRTDGTKVGTSRIFKSELGINNPQIIGGKLYFTADANTWQSDGSATGTIPVKTIPADPSQGQLPAGTNGLTTQVFHGETYFVEYSNGDKDYVLMKSDGTLQGTDDVKQLSDVDPGSDAFAVLGKSLYLLTADGELWKSDGTRAGTHQLRAPSTDADAFTDPIFLIAAANRIFFSAATESGVPKLWTSDGTGTGTKMLKNLDVAFPIHDENDSNVITDVAVRGDTLYFSADDGAHGIELWQSDGTSNGTKLVQDIYPAGDVETLSSSWPQDMTVSGSTLYFSAADLLHGRELWELPLS